MSTKMVVFVYFVIERRNCVSMIAAEVPSHATAACRAINYIFSWAVIIIWVLIADLGAVIAEIDKVKVCRCYIEILISKVS